MSGNSNTDRSRDSRADNKLFLSSPRDLVAQAVTKSQSLRLSTMEIWPPSVSRLVRKQRKKLSMQTPQLKSQHNNNSPKLLQSICQASKSQHSKITLSKISEISRQISSPWPPISVPLLPPPCPDKEATMTTIPKSSP